jgi:hypothetical protein
MGTGVDFDKICVFCDKCCARIDKCVFIVIKIKCMNSGRVSDICDKVNFTTKLHIFYNTRQAFYQNTHKYYNLHSAGQSRCRT